MLNSDVSVGTVLDITKDAASLLSSAAATKAWTAAAPAPPSSSRAAAASSRTPPRGARTLPGRSDRSRPCSPPPPPPRVPSWGVACRRATCRVFSWVRRQRRPRRRRRLRPAPRWPGTARLWRGSGRAPAERTASQSPVWTQRRRCPSTRKGSRRYGRPHLLCVSYCALNHSQVRMQRYIKIWYC